MSKSLGWSNENVKKSEKDKDTYRLVIYSVEAPQGIDTFVFNIDSSNKAFSDKLAAMGLDGEFDIANPDENLTGALAQLAELGVELPFGKDVKGKTELRDINMSGIIPWIFGFIESGGNSTFVLVAW